MKSERGGTCPAPGPEVDSPGRSAGARPADHDGRRRRNHHARALRQQEGRVGARRTSSAESARDGARHLRSATCEDDAHSPPLPTTCDHRHIAPRRTRSRRPAHPPLAPQTHMHPTRPSVVSRVWDFFAIVARDIEDALGSDNPRTRSDPGRTAKKSRSIKYILMMNTPCGEPLPGRQLAAEGLPGAHRVHEEPHGSAHARQASSWRPRAWRGPTRQARARWQGRHADHRRGVPGDQGVPRRVLDRGRREPRARATRSPREASAAPGPGGAPLNMGIEVREVMSATAQRSAERPLRSQGAGEHLLRDLAPQVLGAVIAAIPRFQPPRGRGQEGADRGAPRGGRAKACPDEPRALATTWRRGASPDQVRSEAARRRREAIVVSTRAAQSCQMRPRRRQRRGRSRTTRSPCCSCAATRRSPRRPRSR